MIKTASYFDQLENRAVRCRLCPADCRLTEGKAGICESRFNQGGVLVTDNYAELVTLALDPIEKKPLYHFYPGSYILSTGPNSCNLGCLHCQNWTISQQKIETTAFSPERLVEAAVQHNSIGVAFTYTEPIMWFEYIMDAAPLLHRQNLKVVLVTNGYVNPEPLEDLLGITDAANIDLKGMRGAFYARVCKGKLAPVLDTIRRVAASPVHLELTNLIIPGENDSDEDLASLIDFVASVSDRIPVHFSAYHPDYKMTHAPTPRRTVLRAKEMASRRLKYVYVGNVPSDEGAETYCPACGSALVSRYGYHIRIRALRNGRCVACGERADFRQ